MKIKNIFLFCIILLFIVPAVSAGSLTREFSKLKVSPGEEITVAYSVEPQNAEFWAVDEIIPNGWQVKEAEVYSGHLRWFATQTPSKTYIFIAPNEEGVYDFDKGSYQIYGDDNWYNFDPASIEVVGECMAIFSPKETIYKERRIQFNLTTIMQADEIIYIDYADRSPRWRTLCRDCNEYGNVRTRTKSFGDGEHNLSFRAVKDGNYDEKNVSFFMDSKNPRITKTEPRRGFADGNFYVEFIEENPETLTLNYGNSFREKEVDLETCSELGRGKMACNISADLSEFEGKEINYWFTLEDIAGNSAQSRAVTVEVDQTDPEINNFDYMVNGRRVTFNISITEKNFDSVKYLDNEEASPRWKSLCSRLRDGICLATKYFRTGPHNLVINTTDEAGNYASIEDISIPIS